MFGNIRFSIGASAVGIRFPVLSVPHCVVTLCCVCGIFDEIDYVLLFLYSRKSTDPHSPTAATPGLMNAVAELEASAYADYSEDEGSIATFRLNGLTAKRM